MAKTKKPEKKPKAKARFASTLRSVAELERTIAEQAQEIREGLEQQAATSEILRVIAASTTDLQPVLDAVAENAARLCEAANAVIYRIDGDVIHPAAVHGFMPPAPEGTPINRKTVVGRAIVDRKTLHVHDLLAEVDTEYPESKEIQKITGTRTSLSTPLLREGSSIGAIHVRRNEVRPFSDRQIKLLETFADQAVIAIENVRLFNELQARNRDLAEALEQQTATSEILSVIASSPTDVQPVLNTVAINAARLCEAPDAQIRLVEDDGTRLVASFGTAPAPEFVRNTPRNPAGRAILNRETVHVNDIVEAMKNEFPDIPEMQTRSTGTRTFLSTPMLREGIPIGLINIRRTEVRPFSAKQIALLKTFADQAVIAIENVRLFKEIQQRNAELREALEHQTATAEVLGIISRSPTDVQPVLDAIVASAARVCGIDDVVLRLIEGNITLPRAHFGPIPINVVEISIDEPRFRWVREHGTLHIPDVRAQSDFPTFGTGATFHTQLIVPLRQQEELIGALNARRTEVRPFTPAQIKLLETFADQGVIAIENVRLFQELKESLEQQTATSEILGVIASSPTDIQPVLDAVAENAARLCDATDAQIIRVEGDFVRPVASYGPMPARGPEERTRITPTQAPTLAIINRQTIHVHDMAAEVESRFPESKLAQQRFGTRTLLCAPLLREGVSVGAILIRRTEVRSFTDKQIKLLETFASQAVIAIENVRLFKELQERNRALTEALEQQTATSEVLAVIAGSPTELQPVLDTVVANAVRLAGAKKGHILQYDGELLRHVSNYNESLEETTLLRRLPVKPAPESLNGRAFIERKPFQRLDVNADTDYQGPGRQAGARTALSVPLLREGTAIGTILIWRDFVEAFTDRQIELVKTFADQAVIAIENVRLFQELKEALEQQTATSEILGVIASSPTDLQPVLDAVAKSASRLCDATDAVIYRADNNVYRPTASYGPVPVGESDQPRPIDRGRIPGRAMIDRQTIHIHDLAAEPADDLPAPFARSHGVRTALATPLLREGIAIGAIFIRRLEVRPFTDKQIKLLETFADQAVIAIENVRLFKELQERNAELREALEHQTATAEVLGIISRSPTDVQPVLDAIVESAARVCGVDDVLLRLQQGNMLTVRAHFGSIPIGRAEVSVDEPTFLWIRQHGTLHIQDTRAALNDFPVLGSAGWRSWFAVPLRQRGEFIGTLGARRIEVRPFTSAQMKLLETFADQAVIALENVRLFNELKESLEQQTATSEILGVIASSPTDIQPVLEAVAENAAKITGSDLALIYRVDGDNLRRAAKYGPREWGPLGEIGQRLTRGTAAGRAVLDRQVVHVPDLLAAQSEFPDVRRHLQYGSRTVLSTPLLREGVPIGVIHIRRTEVRPFTEKQIKLLETFADQAVIAIENVRLFNELDTRNRQLTEALEQQTATSEILRVIASSPTNVQPVLDVVAENAARLCDAHDAIIHRLDGDRLRDAAHYGPISRTADATQTPLNRDSVAGRAVVDRGVVHVQDMQAESETEFPLAKSRAVRDGTRSVVGTPLLREGVPIGAILIRRTEVRPFTDKQIALLKTFADQAVIAIENVRLFKELQERTRELVESVEEMKALSEVGQAVSSSLDLATVLETIVARAVDLSGTDCGVIYEYDEEAQEFNLRASHRMEVEAVEGLRAARIKFGEGATGQAALTRTPVQIPDTFGQREGSVSRLRPLLNRLGYRSLLTVPILRDHQIMGGLTVWRRQVGEFEPEVVNLLQTFATQSALAIKTPGCSGKSRIRAARSRLPTGTSRSFSPTCRMSCARR